MKMLQHFGIFENHFLTIFDFSKNNFDDLEFSYTFDLASSAIEYTTLVEYEVDPSTF